MFCYNEDYADAGTDPMAQLKTSMQEESAAILHLIFSHYREAALLFYGSTGSSLEHYFGIVTDCPDRETAEKYMSALMTYHFGGWVALFDSADKLQRKEDSYEI